MSAPELKKAFDDAIAYRITLPNSYEFKKYLTPESLEKISSNYGTFVNTMRARFQEFLDQQGEPAKIVQDTVIDVLGPSHVGLEFWSRPESVAKMNEAMEAMFEGFDLCDELKAQGASWKYFKVDKFDDVKWGLV